MIGKPHNYAILMKNVIAVVILGPTQFPLRHSVFCIQVCWKQRLSTRKTHQDSGSGVGSTYQIGLPIVSEEFGNGLTIQSSIYCLFILSSTRCVLRPIFEVRVPSFVTNMAHTLKTDILPCPILHT